MKEMIDDLQSRLKKKDETIKDVKGQNAALED